MFFPFSPHIYIMSWLMHHVVFFFCLYNSFSFSRCAQHLTVGLWFDYSVKHSRPENCPTSRILYSTKQPSVFSVLQIKVTDFIQCTTFFEVVLRKSGKMFTLVWISWSVLMLFCGSEKPGFQVLKYKVFTCRIQLFIVQFNR